MTIIIGDDHYNNKDNNNDNNKNNYKDIDNTKLITIMIVNILTMIETFGFTNPFPRGYNLR